MFYIEIDYIIADGIEKDNSILINLNIFFNQDIACLLVWVFKLF